MIKRFFLIIALLSYQVGAKQLTIASADGPPHMIAASNSGINLDIVKQILNEMGYSYKFIYAPLRRAEHLVTEGTADLYVPSFFDKDNQSLYFSNPIIQYRPTVFSLTDKSINFTEMNDLANYSVASFQGAKGYFGDSYRKAVGSTDYREIHDMKTLPTLLIHSRTDLVVLDYYIFFYYLKQNHPDVDANSIATKPLMPSANAYVAFNSRELKDIFNKHLATFIKQERDKKIINKYIGELE